MSNYTKTVDFASKDTLPSGDSGKIIKGTEFETEFDNIATAVATKADSAAPTFTGTSVFANLDISGDIDVDGTTNLDAVDIDGAVDMATTLAVAGNVDFNGDLDVDGTTNLDAVDIDGAVDFASTTAHAGNATFADDAKAIFGAGSDLQIYHSGTHSYIKDAGTGNLNILASTSINLLNGDSSDYMARFVEDGGATLYYDGSSKLATVSGGVSVTGELTATSLDISGDIDVDGTTNLDVVDIDGAVDFASTTAHAGNATFADNAKAIFGAGSDLQIYHNGSDSYIDNVGAGSLIIQDTDGNGDIYIRPKSGQTAIGIYNDNTVEIAHSGNVKLATTSTGIDVTGTVVADFLITDDDVSGLTTLGRYSSGIAYSLLRPSATATGIEIRTNAGNALAHFLNDGTTKLHHNNSPKLATTSTGIDVTGTVQATGYLAVEGTSGNTGAAGDRWIGGDGTAGTWFYNVPTGSNHYFGVNNANKFVIASDGSLSTPTAGTSNVRFGVNAGNSIVSGGNYNTVVGDEAGTAITNGEANVALGWEALKAEDTGNFSTAIGYRALRTQNNDASNYNTAVGALAGQAVTTGTNNTFVGGLAGDTITTGNYNVIVGSQSDSTAVDSEKAQGFGFNLACAAGYTTIGSGSDDIRAAHGNVTWATVSDERYKKDIVDSEAGLSLINALRPRTFKYKTLGELPETFNAFEADSTEVFKNSDTNHGFIAQEVKAAIDADDSIKDGFRLWDDRDDGSQEVAEAALIPVLVKAIQELTARIETLEG